MLDPAFSRRCALVMRTHKIMDLTQRQRFAFAEAIARAETFDRLPAPWKTLLLAAETSAVVTRPPYEK